ncbi:MAG: AMP-binding protein [Pseudomonadota bacterium]|nr:AMP-binding protein [Pseudomonadota bacterium]
MASLTDFTRYADAHANFSKQALWNLFDGNLESLNIGWECIDRHPPHRTAVNIALADGGSECYTFGNLRNGSNRFAQWLVARGVVVGDRVGIMLDPCAAFYFALFGAMKCGAIAVPLFPLFGSDGLNARLTDCSPRLLLTTKDLARLIPNQTEFETIIIDKGFSTELNHYDAEYSYNTNAESIAMYQYTSGTTRELPEAVKHRHRAIVTVMIAALYATGIRPGDRYMCPSSPAWGHGLWHGTLAPLAMGVEISTYSGRFDPNRLYKALHEFGITNLSAAATHYRMMKNAGCGSNANSSKTLNIEKLSFTGEPIDDDTENWARSTFGVPICSIYGTTEVGVVLASYPGAPDFKVCPGSLGKPVPGVELDIHDEAGNSCTPGQIGEIVLRRRNGWFSVKDLAHRDDDGYWWHHGRADDVIISAGWTMSAKEIENTLLAHPEVNEAAAIAVPDEARGQIAKAFIVSKREGDEEFAIELQEFTKQRLARHEYPRQIEFISSLPKTPAGKVNRKKLRDRETARLDQ